MNNYRILSESLREVADSVLEFLKKDRGIKKFKIEEPITANLAYRPTFFGASPELYLVAAEVQETPDPSLLDSIVLECVSLGLALKLYVAFPEKEGHNPLREIEKARRNGLGVIEVRKSGPHVVAEAMPLSLWGYRLDRMKFPPRYRSLLVDAENTYRGGSPAKACGLIYDEIEAISRKLGVSTEKKGMWRGSPTLNLQTGAWQKVMEEFANNFIRARYPALSSSLLHRVMGVTAHRNESGHKPLTAAQRVKRDSELRTRFEAAADLLLELINLPKIP